jgi:hypothetical protein
MLSRTNSNTKIMGLQKKLTHFKIIGRNIQYRYSNPCRHDPKGL